MSFTPEQIAALAAPLAREHVRSRDQGRGKVSYIEGWHAIAEMNRIFGFDGWARETVMSECCHAGPYQKAVYENGHRTNRTVESFRCSYRARVRITVGDVVREGSGHGHGFADNPGEAHESAEKEAETDAMKRALMTLGNPLGLALYDKTQSEVEPVQGRPTMPGPGSYAPRPKPADGQVTSPGSRPAEPASPPQTPTGRAPDRAAQERAMREGAAALPVSPEEPPEVGEARRAARARFWTREHYGIDPAVIHGGMARWDAEMIAQADAAPNLDAFIKLKQDNREAGFVTDWENTVATPVIKHFRGKMLEIERRLSGGIGAAAQ